MKPAILFLAFLIAIGMAAPRLAPAAANDTVADPNRLIALENAWNLAQLNHNAGALESLVSDNFVYTDYDGTVMDKARFLADLQDPDYRASVIANENVKVFPYQNVAIVVGTYHSKGTYKGKAFDHWGRFTDTWLFLDGKWQCVASHTNLNKK